MKRLVVRGILPIAALAVVIWGVREFRDRAARNAPPAPAPATRAVDSTAHTRLAPPLVAATYMGGNWPKNFINGFRREDVAPDFARLRSDGFNAVVLLVSWGDFQPVFDPCCAYDERAFSRLQFLIERARDAGLDVVLRIGYGWTFHPHAGEVGARIHRLLNEDKVRAAYFDYVSRLGQIVRRHANVRLSLLSWEDLILHTIDDDGRADFQEFVATLPAGDPRRAAALAAKALPHRDGADGALFNAYWDWLLMHKIFAPAAQRIAHLSFEARIDSDPLPKYGAAGQVEYDWVGHESTYHPPGADTIALYWAPFWGAQNQGEQLDAQQALHLFGTLLDKVRQHSGGLPMFIDQLNVIDNTLGFERNATLQPAAWSPFLDGALCTMKNAGVFGYAYWTAQDYAESPLYNPAFSYRLDGWALTTGDHAAADSRLRERASGDFDLRLEQGDAVAQTIAQQRGRLPGIEAHLPATVCVSIESDTAATLQVDADALPAKLDFVAGGARRVCSAMATHANGDALQLTIRAVRGSVDLSHVALFDHIQRGGLYAPDGKPEALLPGLRRLNAAFAGQDASACVNPASR